MATVGVILMYSKDIIDSNNNIKSCVDVKNKLNDSDFFNEERMTRLLAIIKEENNMTNYVSTEYVGDRMIRMSLRQNYFKKFNYSPDPMDYYSIINNAVERLIDENLPEVMGIIGNDADFINNIHLNVGLLYCITRPTPGIIVIDFD